MQSRQSDDQFDQSPDQRRNTGKPGRLNLLLSYAGWQDQNWANQLPCLLEPLGISSIRVNSGAEAAQVISQHPIHIAVVDLRLPLEEATSPRGAEDDLMPQEDATEGGMRILQLLRRLDSPPPTVVVRPPADRQHQRMHQRTLNQALREGAFAVMDVPVPMEQLLETMRRILKRYYQNMWPN